MAHASRCMLASVRLRSARVRAEGHRDHALAGLRLVYGRARSGGRRLHPAAPDLAERPSIRGLGDRGPAGIGRRPRRDARRVWPAQGEPPRWPARIIPSDWRHRSIALHRDSAGWSGASSTARHSPAGSRGSLHFHRIRGYRDRPRLGSLVGRRSASVDRPAWQRHAGVSCPGSTDRETAEARRLAGRHA